MLISRKKKLKRLIVIPASVILCVLIAANIIFIVSKNKQLQIFDYIGQNNTTVKIIQTLISVGRKPLNSNVEVQFKILNTGKNPLVIQDVDVECHCTTVSYSKKPILSGDSALIRVKYDSSILGFFQKKITVKMNTKNSPLLLIFRGEVY